MALRFVFILGISAIVFGFNNSALAQDQNTHLISVYDRGITRTFITQQKTIGKALEAAHITLDSHDAVEPATSQKLIASRYFVNIYRARPVLVIDGSTRIKTISAHQTTGQIASDVGISIYDGDTTTLVPITNFAGDGAGLELTIIRAKSISLNLYGKQVTVRTQAKTVGDMLRKKGITLGKKDHVSPLETTSIIEGLEVRVWREGIQTLSIDEQIPVNSTIVYDADQPIGYRGIQTAGTPGIRSITYQLDIQGGVEVSRAEIASIVTRNPTDQIEVIGLRNDGTGLAKAKGAQYYTDSKGVSHRETYYDLNMATALLSCGQGGHYSVRPDGAKVDTKGYIIVAAGYSNYPKCSIVETSLGLGKVYDTGGFASRYPNGFDLATDWSTPDGI